MMRPTFSLKLSCFCVATCLAAPSLWAQESIPLTLQQLVQGVRSEGLQIQAAKLQRDLAATGIERAGAAFQPQITASITDSYSSQVNTFEESLTRGQRSDYWRRGADASLGLSQLFNTGAKLEAKLSSSRFDTNLNRLQSESDPQTRPPGSLDYRSQWSINLVQPIARDAGVAVNMARSEVARLDAEGSAKDLQRTQTTGLAEALVAYYELSLSGERVKVAEAKIRMGERLLADARELLANGRLPEADVWEVENALARFNAERSAARQGEREKSNRIKSLLMLSAMEQPGLLRAVDPLPSSGAEFKDVQQIKSVALQRREDLHRLRLASEREDVQMMYARNQSKPRVDVVLSYGRSDLALGWRSSLSAMPSPSWSVGVQVQMPLGANRQGRADIEAALARQKEAQLKLVQLETDIANEVDTAFGLYQSAQERLADWIEIARRENQAVEIERQRLVAGRSGMREVLNREERSHNANLGLYEQRVALAQALVLLASAQGVLEELWP